MTTADKRHSVTSIATAALARYRLVNYQGTHAGPNDAVQGVSEVAVAAGRAVPLTTHYSQLVEAAGAIASGAAVGAASDGSGRVVANPVTVTGRALSAATAAGDLIEMKLEFAAGAAAALTVAEVAGLKANRPLGSFAGVVLDGTTDCTAGFGLAMASGARVSVEGPCYLNGTLSVPGNGTEFIGAGGYFIFGPNFTYSGSFASGVKFSGLTFIGHLNEVQYQRLTVEGVGLTAYLTAGSNPGTYSDAAGNNAGDVGSIVAGADFEHIYASPMLSVSTVGMAANAGTIIRNVRTAPYVLDPAQRYVVDFKDGLLVSGNSGGLPLVETFSDNAGTVSTGLYLPTEGSTLTKIEGARSIRIHLRCVRFSHSVVGLQSVYDLRKIDVYQLVNEFAPPSGSNPNGLVNGARPWDTGSLLFGNSTGIEFDRCTFRRMIAPISFAANTTGCKVTNSTFAQVIQGIGVPGAADILIDGNTADGRFKDQNGDLVNNIVTRTRFVSGALSKRITITNNPKTVGFNWTYELSPACDGTIISGNPDIRGQMAGISLAGIGVKVNNNGVTMAGWATFGIELPECTGEECTGNTVTFPGMLNGVGISCSTNGGGGALRRNTIMAPLGIKHTPALGIIPGGQENTYDFNAEIEGCVVAFSAIGIYSETPGLRIKGKNTIKPHTFGATYGALGGTSPATIFINVGQGNPARVTTVLQVLDDNDLEPSNTYCVRLSGVRNLLRRGNRIKAKVAPYFVTDYNTAVAGVVMTHDEIDNQYTGPLSSTVAWDNTPAAGSGGVQRGNTLNGAPAFALYISRSTWDDLSFYSEGGTASNTAHSYTAQLPGSASANNVWMVTVRFYTGANVNDAQGGTWVVTHFSGNNNHNPAPTLLGAVWQHRGASPNIAPTVALALTVSATGLLTATTTLATAAAGYFIVTARQLA